MVETLAKTIKDIAETAKDIKEYVPSFLKDGKLPEKGTENVFEPVSRKSKEGFTEYQRELLSDEYGLSDEEIGQYANWEDFEKEFLSGKDDIHDVTSGTQHSGKIYNEGELVKKDSKDDYTKYDGEVIKQDREVKTSHPLIVDSTDDVAYLKEPIESKNFPKGPESYRDFDKESVLKKDSWKEQDTNSLISNKLKDTPENNDSKKDNEAKSEGFQYPEDSMLAVFNKKDTSNDEVSDTNTDEVGEEKKGGSYRDVRKTSDGSTEEVHHMPADSASYLERDDGPAIKMDKEDHRQTASCGSSREAREYREQQKELIDEGKFREALQMDIDDIHDKFGDKYDDAIAEMLEYVDQLEQEGRI